jgi:hypothetical protein
MTKSLKLKDIVKTMLFLEDKLFSSEKCCIECMKEIMLTIEGLLDDLMQSEVKSDKKLYPILEESNTHLRKIQVQLKKGKCNYEKVAQQLRQLRKKLMDDHMFVLKKKELKTDYVKKIMGHKCKYGLLPILDPRFNIREAVKQILLLEDHFFDKQRKCWDCQKKHSLLIEAFVEEGITLDKKQKYSKVLKEMLCSIRKIQKMILVDRRKGSHDIIEELRKIRKKKIGKKTLLDFAFDYTDECLG